MSAPRAPYVRPLYGPDDHRHSRPGDDVLALKRGYWRAGFLDGPASKFDREYNRRAVEATKAFQRHAHIQPTGHVGHATWEALRLTRREGHPGEWAFDDQAVKLAEHALAATQETPHERAQRLGTDAAAFWIIHRDESAYAETRPFPLVKPPAIPRVTDCSGYATTVYYAAGAPDPNGRGYDGQGYTGTLVGQGRAVSVHEADLLDLVFYGFTTHATPAFPYGSPTHVAVYIGGGYVASDGSQSGPQKRPMGYRAIHSVRRYPLA